MSLPQLPAEYHKAASIRLDRERKTAIKLTLWSVAIFAGLVLLRVMFGLFLPAVRLQFPEDLVFLSLMVFGILLGSLVAAILHEIIHAVYMKHAGAKGVKFGFTLGYAYTAAPQAFFSREEYLRITLAPAVILKSYSSDRQSSVFTSAQSCSLCRLCAASGRLCRRFLCRTPVEASFPADARAGHRRKHGFL